MERSNLATILKDLRDKDQLTSPQYQTLKGMSKGPIGSCDAMRCVHKILGMEDQKLRESFNHRDELSYIGGGYHKEYGHITTWVKERDFNEKMIDDLRGMLAGSMVNYHKYKKEADSNGLILEGYNECNMEKIAQGILAKHDPDGNDWYPNQLEDFTKAAAKNLDSIRVRIVEITSLHYTYLTAMELEEELHEAYRQSLIALLEDDDLDKCAKHFDVAAEIHSKMVKHMENADTHLNKLVILKTK